MSNSVVPISNAVPRLPKYRLHKPTGQAVVSINGRDIYLGKWNTRASRSEYDRVIGEWLPAGRCMPQRRGGKEITIAELALAYLRFAKTYYRRDGRPTGELSPVKDAIRFLRTFYGHTLVSDFGPLSLESLQMRLVAAGLARSTINSHICRIRRVFRWGVAKEMIPASILEALRALPGLRRGRTSAREPKPVLPVPDEVVEGTLPYLPPVVCDMVRFERLTGCRPGEVCMIRPVDVDRSGEVWQYVPERHKTEHHGRKRVIFIGPKAQAILLPYLLRDSQARCFQPSESEAKRKARMRAQRRTPVQPSQLDRSKPRPKRKPREHYTKDAYNRAIRRAIAKANAKLQAEAEKAGTTPQLLPRWHPNQLRHSAATEIRKQFGLEPVQAVLGHASMNVSEIYAEKNMELAAAIMRKIG